jgi:hypothetical protein
MRRAQAGTVPATTSENLVGLEDERVPPGTVCPHEPRNHRVDRSLGEVCLDATPSLTDPRWALRNQSK